MFKNILVPITPSSSCEQAADAAISFAQSFGSTLTLLHVYGFEHLWGEAELLALPGELDRIKAGMASHYADKLQGLPKHMIVAEQGVPHVEILRKAREIRADLIVMCPSAKQLPAMDDLQQPRVGHTLERVLQEASCPVMMVSHPAPHGEGVFRRVIAATGFSAKDALGVDYASQVARKCNAGLTVLNILDTDTAAANMPQEEIARVISERTDRMAAEYGALAQGAADVEYVCHEGQTAVEILKLARLRGADVIVMAHHSRESDPECAFERSTVVNVAFRALCPVVSINRKFTIGESAA